MVYRFDKLCNALHGIDPMAGLPPPLQISSIADIVFGNRFAVVGNGGKQHLAEGFIRRIEPACHLLNQGYPGGRPPCLDGVIEEKDRCFQNMSGRITGFSVSFGLESPIGFSQIMEHGDNGETIQIEIGEDVAGRRFKPPPKGGQGSQPAKDNGYIQAVGAKGKAGCLSRMGGIRRVA